MKNDDLSGFWFCVIALVIFFGTWFGWQWYKSSVQVGVYARQGVQMSTWEVFLGAKPVERMISTK